MQMKCERKLHPCTFSECRNVYTRRDRLLTHIQKFHSENNESQAGGQLDKRENQPRKSRTADSFGSRKTLQVKKQPKLYPCKISNCGIMYTRRDRFLAHMEKVHPEPIDLLDPVNEKRRSLRPRKMGRPILDFSENSDSDSKTSDYEVCTTPLPSSEEDGICDTGGNSSHRQNSRGKRMRIKKEGSSGCEKSVIVSDARRTCPECTETYASMKSIILHIRKDHGGLRCPACGKMFTNPEKFTAHKQRRHSNNDSPTGSQIRISWTPKDIVCFYCGDKFTTIEEHMEHRGMHYGKSEMQRCKLCGIMLKGLLGLRHHMMIVHLGFPHQSTEKRRIRKYTDKSLPVPKAVLATLVKVPTIYCDVCGKKFYWEYKLQAHKEREHQEGYVPGQPRSNRYVCNVCGLHCRAPSFLRAHERVHTKEKPFICDVCGATYRTSHILRKHISKKHPEITLPRQFEYGGEDRFTNRSAICDVFADLEKEKGRVSDSEENEPVSESEEIMVDIRSLSNQLVVETSQTFEGAATIPEAKEINVSEVKVECKLEPVAASDCIASACSENKIMMEPSAADFDETDDEPISPFPNSWDMQRQDAYRRSVRLLTDKKPEIPLTVAEFNLNLDVKIESNEGQLDHCGRQLPPPVEDDSRIRHLKQRRNLTSQISSLVSKKRKRKRKPEKGVKCRLNNCRFRAPDADTLAAHRINEHGRTDAVRSYNFKCRIKGCTFRARYQESLDSHVLKHQIKGEASNDYALKCRIDSCRFMAPTLDILAWHRSSQHGRTSDIRSYPFKCLVAGCNFRARFENSLESHRLSHTNSPPCSTKVSTKSLGRKKKVTNYPCTFHGCGRIFTHRIRLVRHIENIHHGKAKLIQEAKSPWFKRAVMCRMSGCTFKTRKRSELESHRAVFHNSECGFSGSNKRNAETGNKNGSLTQWNHCDIPNCKYKAILIESLEAHIRKVHQRLPILRHFKCSHCPKSFRSNHYRQVHFKLKHSPDEPQKPRYRCKHCEKDFCNRHILLGHIQRCHPETKTFPCSTCGKLFYEEAENRNHEIRHASYPETPFRCACYCCTEICKSQNELRQHVKEIHDAPIDTKILCATCGKDVIARNFASHRQRHKNVKSFTCHLCSKAFRRQSDLDRHSELHHPHIVFQDKKKTESCGMCDSTFWTKAALKSHEYSHKRKLDPKIRRTRSAKKKQEATTSERRQRRKREKKLPPSPSPSASFPSFEPDVCKDNFADTFVTEVVQHQGQPTMVHYHHQQYNSLAPNFFPPLNSNPTQLAGSYTNHSNIRFNLYHTYR